MLVQVMSKVAFPDVTSVCIGILNQVLNYYLGDLALDSYNNFIHRQVAGVEYIMLILFTKISVHRAEKVCPASQAFQKTA